MRWEKTRLLTVLWTLRERERVGRFGRMALKHVKYHVRNEMPVQPGSMHDTGCLGLVHWDDPEGWCGKGGGRRVQDGARVYLWRIHFDIWQN